MPHRTGSATLPLHTGKAPRWLFDRMSELAPAIAEVTARFSFAHGGKDGHPYPVNRDVYDGTVGWLTEAVAKAKIGHSERLKALKRLGEWAAA